MEFKLTESWKDHACLRKNLENRECNEAREQNSQAPVSKDQIQKPLEGKEKEREEGGGELLNRSEIKKKEEKTRAIFQLLRVENLDING